MDSSEAAKALGSIGGRNFVKKYGIGQMKVLSLKAVEAKRIKAIEAKKSTKNEQ